MTPDRDALKRNKDLFLRIRKSHPHNMRPVGYMLHDHQDVLGNLARIEQQLPHFSAVLAFVRERLQLSFARQQLAKDIKYHIRLDRVIRSAG